MGDFFVDTAGDPPPLLGGLCLCHVSPSLHPSFHQVYVLPQIARPKDALLQTQDHTGIKAGLMWQGLVLHTPNEIAHPPPDPEAQEAYVNHLRTAIRTYFAHVSHTEREVVRCLYTTTPDTDFVVYCVPGHSNIVLLGGFSGHGFKFGPAIGEAAADLVLGASPQVPLQRFALDRFNEAPQ